MHRNTVYGAVHRVIGDEMDVVPFFGKVFRPALGVDAPGIGDEKENHGMRAPWGLAREIAG
ncbi:MAG: hypothetical protein STSR0009_19230 [Methanoregula sp.]